MTSIYDMIKKKENEIAVLQEEVSGLQAEIEALHVAAGMLEEGIRAETRRPDAMRTRLAARGDKNKNVWP
jgi:hypothetical protein